MTTYIHCMCVCVCLYKFCTTFHFRFCKIFC